MGAVAVNSWQVFRTTDLLSAKAMREAAEKKVADAAEDLKKVDEAERVAGEAHRGDPKSMSGIELDIAIKFVYVAKPEQPTARTGIKGKAVQANFLSNMVPSWTSLFAGARLACAAAATAASTALAEAEAAETAAIADNQPPAPPSVAPGAVTAAGVDVTSMSDAEKRALLALLTSSLPS